ncbi:MAG TPA: hypothetical protein VML55_15660 [Planctomycetaceae bacterium]|nr:hypothetical protein [Planctomycetaceae bacterium]
MPVEVAVTLIRNQDRLLLVYNDRWGAFTLPMSKRRVPEGAAAADDSEAESWLDAAARPVAECLGRLSRPRPVLEDFLPEGHFSLRRRAHAIYRYRVFEVLVEEGDRVVARTANQWLTAREIVSGEFHPISPTAVEIIRYDQVYRHVFAGLEITP